MFSYDRIIMDPFPAAFLWFKDLKFLWKQDFQLTND